MAKGTRSRKLRKNEQRKSSQAPALEDPHDTLKRQIAELASDLLRLVESHNRYSDAANSVGTLYIKLSTQAERVGKLGEMAKARPDDRAAQAQLIAATRQMAETQMSFNLQYLQLQNQMQNENRQFTMVSNVMKTKHDTVKNSISNIR